MRKYLIIGQQPPPHHGSNYMASILLSSLIELDKNFIFIDKDLSTKFTEVGRIKFSKIKRLIKLIIKFTRTLLIYKPNYVMIFISSSMPGLIPDILLILITNLLRIPFILYIHGQGHKCNSESKSYFLKWAYNKQLSKVDSIITLSKKLKDDVEFFKKPIYFLPNCLSQNDEKLIGILLAKAPAIKNGFTALFLGNLFEEKGLMIFLKAANIVLKTFPDTKFKIIGEWNNSEFKVKSYDYLSKNNLLKQIIFVGPKYQAEKYESLILANILVFPTLNEAFGLVNIEAMACNLPVISSKIGAIPDIVDDGVTGFVVECGDYVDVANKIKYLIGNQETATRMGILGKARFCSKYSYSYYSNNLSKILENIDKGENKTCVE